MNCPVCDRSLAPTLSICPSCGAMMHDTVREELQAKVTSGRLTPRVEIAELEPSRNARAFASKLSPPARPVLPTSPTSVVEIAVVSARRETADLVVPKTSPTLIGFQGKNITLPDWRIQLQNAVQQRKSVHSDSVAASAPATHHSSNDTAAFRAEVVQRSEQIKGRPEILDPRVVNAMRRINESRDTFLAAEKNR